MRSRLCGGLWVTSLLLCPPVWAAPEAGGLAQLDALAQRDSDIPALLNYAQTNRDRQPALPREPAARKPVQAADKAAARLMKTVREQQATLGRQADTIAQLTASLNALKAQAAQTAPSPALQAEIDRQKTALTRQAAEIARLTAATEAQAGQRQGDTQAQARLTAELKTLSLQQTAERQQLTAATRALKARDEALAEREKQLVTLKATVAASAQAQTSVQQRLAAKQAELDKVAGQLADRERFLTALQKTQDDTAKVLQEKQAALVTTSQTLTTTTQTLAAKSAALEDAQRAQSVAAATLKAQEVTLAQLRQTLDERTKTVDALQAARQKAAAPVVLKSEGQQQSYAVGTSLGGDVVRLLAERQAQGAKLDRTLVLAGVQDAFSGQYRLKPDAINKALYDSAVVVNRSLTQAKTKAREDGARYLKAFRQKTGSQALPDQEGVWYRTEYAGEGAIGPDDVVDVVMKESLPDGTVVSDMEASGKVISQPLSAYPPLFRAALATLKNHGNLELVVPPEKAYGDEGLPPKVPPGATMIYRVRIVDVRPAGAGGDAATEGSPPSGSGKG